MVSNVAAESKSDDKKATHKSTYSKSANAAITADGLADGVQSESRGPNEQERMEREETISLTEIINRDEDGDTLFDFPVSPERGESTISNLTTEELRANVNRIMSATISRQSPTSNRVKKNFVIDLLSDSDDDESLDAGVSLKSKLSTDESSILPDDPKLRSDMIDSMLASMNRDRACSPLNTQDLKKSKVRFFESPTGSTISVTYATSVSSKDASACMELKEFIEWVQLTSRKYGAKRITVMKLKILNVEKDKEGAIASVKLQAECKLKDEEASRSWRDISETFTLRRESLGLLISLICNEDNTQWSLLVDRPCVPLGRPSALELPTVVFDALTSTYKGVAIKPLNDLCGIEIIPHEMVNLTEETYAESNSNLGKSVSMQSNPGMTPDPTESNEAVKLLHLSKRVTQKELQQIRKNISEAREDGTEEGISLRVIPTSEIWKVSTDMKVMCALFLLEKRCLAPGSGSVQSRPGSVQSRTQNKPVAEEAGEAGKDRIDGKEGKLHIGRIFERIKMVNNLDMTGLKTSMAKNLDLQVLKNMVVNNTDEKGRDEE